MQIELYDRNKTPLGVVTNPDIVALMLSLNVGDNIITPSGKKATIYLRQFDFTHGSLELYVRAALTAEEFGDSPLIEPPYADDEEEPNTTPAPVAEQPAETKPKKNTKK